jgi:galactokinase
VNADTSVAVSRRFREQFDPAGGAFRVEAPGRANLIGEHIDYNGLDVLPMALQRRITVEARRRGDHRIRLSNIDPAYEVTDIEIAPEVPSGPPGDWGNYVRAAAQALCRDHGALYGFEGVVGSDLPAAAGLSSSSALLVATALALLEANGLPVDREALMPGLARAERYVGLAGGGMDQAICLGGVAGAACRIGFDPLRLEAHPVPQDWRFVIASSLVPAEKSAGARQIYNRRTEECREARRLVLRRLGLSGATSYRALLRSFDAEELLLAGRDTLEAQLLARFRHVVTEAERVDRSVEALAAGAVDLMGAQLEASHRSLRDDYRVSCPELDELVEHAVAGGAAGARLTGAGLGGCIIALGAHSDVPAILKHLDAEFYRDRVAPGDLDTVRFVAEPSRGARITPLES